MLVEASAGLDRWLRAWATATSPVAHQRLAEAFGTWEYDLLRDDLPWRTWSLTDDEEEVLRAELTGWLLQHAPTRLRMIGADPDLLDRIRLLGLPCPARWDDPHWPDHAYRPGRPQSAQPGGPGGRVDGGQHRGAGRSRSA
ncbi:hypothetical protein [Micromonospora profundi]|uniref:hypothetical protein n=2 Tax=Micromonospora profundi TaxID=1420889 RepID=UPI003691C445